MIKQSHAINKIYLNLREEEEENGVKSNGALIHLCASSGNHFYGKYLFVSVNGLQFLPKQICRNVHAQHTHHKYTQPTSLQYLCVLYFVYLIWQQANEQTIFSWVQKLLDSLFFFFFFLLSSLSFLRIFFVCLSLLISFKFVIRNDKYQLLATQTYGIFMWTHVNNPAGKQAIHQHLHHPNGIVISVFSDEERRFCSFIELLVLVHAFSACLDVVGSNGCRPYNFNTQYSIS